VSWQGHWGTGKELKGETERMARELRDNLLRRGEVRRVARGLYRRTDRPVTEMETLLMVARMVPDGIFCLLTALRVHEIGTQSPAEVWVAIGHKAREPKIRPWKGRFLPWTGVSLTYGVEDRTMGGVRFRITSPARTIADCFRFRNKIGLDVALEALNDGLRTGTAAVGDITRAAQACQAWTVIKPYLESAVA
jgi:predicted transcriptional regulator of viral defense system